MGDVRAVLLDVFETVISFEAEAALAGLVGASGVAHRHWAAALCAHRHDLMTGAMPPEDVFAVAFRDAGVPTGDLSALVRRDLELLCEHSTVYPDVQPFLHEARRRGIAVALVSNCAPNAGPLIERSGLAAEVDRVVLSCDVGSTKPDAGIFRAALAGLGVDAAHAVLVDDQPAYCSGARAVGIGAVLIDRSGARSESVPSLETVLERLPGATIRA